MKKFILLCILLCNSIMAGNVQSQEPVSLQTQDCLPSGLTVVVHNNTTNTSSPTMTSNANASAQALQVYFDPNALYSGITNFFARNKKKLILGSFVATYGIIFYHVVQGNHYLRSKSRWSTWHPELTLKELRSAPNAQLNAHLLSSIQEEHVSISDPISFASPLGMFMQELAQEEQQLYFYQSLYRWCVRLKIRKLFPFKVKLYKKIGRRLRRIRFLRRRFVKWVTEYKIEQNKIFERAVRLVHTRPNIF